MKPEHLPAHLQIPGALNESNDFTEQAQGHAHYVVAATDSAPSAEATGLTAQPTLHLVIAPASAVDLADLIDSLSECSPFDDKVATASQIRIIPAPRFPPASDEQARKWSERYWPTIYRGGNPFGPHPSLVARAETELRPRAGLWMALAQEVAQQTNAQADGEPIGAVVVGRDHNGSELGAEVIVVAGDARWYGRHQERRSMQMKGNVAAHAVMRAIALVARKRRESMEPKREQEPPDSDASIFLDRPVTPLERELFYANDKLEPTGYLCVGLGLYISHEPCVMCSMAILHSRFDRVVFGQRMSLTGGLSAERRLTTTTTTTTTSNNDDELGYGLFWRPELNWKFLAWMWQDDDDDTGDHVGQDSRSASTTSNVDPSTHC